MLSQPLYKQRVLYGIVSKLFMFKTLQIVDDMGRRVSEAERAKMSIIRNA